MADSTVTFEDVKRFTNIQNETIIDVREPKELEESGKILSSINIPLGTLEDVFQNLPEEDFKAKFGRSKPSKDDPITVHCKMGGRSSKAYDLLRSLGYVNVKNYSGGWMDWEKHLKQQEET